MSISRTNPHGKTALTLLSLVAGAIALSLVAHAPQAVGDISVEPRARHVVCVTQWRPPRAKYRAQPANCTLHRRGVFPIAGYNTYQFKQLKWLRWGKRRALANGKLVVNHFGPVKARLRLIKPKRRCGKAVYTVARVKVWIPDQGPRADRTKIDNCVPLR